MRQPQMFANMRRRSRFLFKVVWPCLVEPQGPKSDDEARLCSLKVDLQGSPQVRRLNFNFAQSSSGRLCGYLVQLLPNTTPVCKNRHY